MWETCSDNMCFLSTRIPQMYDHKVRIYIFFLLKSKPISNKENNTIFIEGVHKENCTTRWPQTRIGTRTRARKPKHGFTSIWVGTEQGSKIARCNLGVNGGYQLDPKLVLSWYQLNTNLVTT